MSGAGPLTRLNAPPRPSVERPAGLLPALIARLVASKACVCTGPPLLASGPRPIWAAVGPNPRLLALGEARTSGPGSTPIKLLTAVIRPLLFAALVLPATETSARPAGVAKFPATMELVSEILLAPLSLPMPPPDCPDVVLVERAVLLVMVLF